MNTKIISFFLASSLACSFALMAHTANSEDNRQSNERNLYDENRARVDKQIWHDEHQFHPNYWTDDDYLYIPENERNYYQPRPYQRYPQTSRNFIRSDDPAAVYESYRPSSDNSQPRSAYYQQNVQR